MVRVFLQFSHVHVKHKWIRIPVNLFLWVLPFFDSYEIITSSFPLFSVNTNFWRSKNYNTKASQSNQFLFNPQVCGIMFRDLRGGAWSILIILKGVFAIFSGSFGFSFSSFSMFNHKSIRILVSLGWWVCVFITNLLFMSNNVYSTIPSKRRQLLDLLVTQVNFHYVIFLAVSCLFNKSIRILISLCVGIQQIYKFVDWGNRLMKMVSSQNAADRQSKDKQANMSRDHPTIF